MGYSTDFTGSLHLSRPVTEEEFKYINDFSATRRMKRDVNKLMKMYKGKFGNPFATGQTPKAIYGRDGEYYVNNTDNDSGQTHDDSIIDYNTPPGQTPYGMGTNFVGIHHGNENRIKDGMCSPGLWCQWIINENHEELEWDGGEKFYYYTEWIKYLIEHFFSKWGILLNGEIEWQGEDPSDFGKIVVVDNVVTERLGRKEYE